MYILETIYDDYDITYQTNINENIIPILILLGILCALIVVYFISMMRIYKKANRSGISAIVPIYNCAVLMEIINESKWKFLLLLIPGVNIVFFCIFMYRLAKYFRKNQFFCIMSAIFPLIMIPILAFSSSEYIGINEEAMKGVSVAKDIPVETSKKPTLSNPDQPLKERTKVNMSIGGGVYQKEYRDSLLEAKTIKETKKPDVAGFRVDPNEFTGAPEAQEPPKSQGGIDLFQNVSFVETNGTQPEMNSPVTESTISQTEPANLLISPLAPVSEVPQVESNNLLSVPLIPTPDSMPQASEMNHSVNPIPGDSQTQAFTNPVDNLLLTPSLQPEQSSSETVNLLGQNNNSVIPPITVESTNSSGFTQPNLLDQNDSVQQEVSSTSSQSNEEFVNCPHCGAKVRNGSTKCFMCGKEL